MFHSSQKGRSRGLEVVCGSEGDGGVFQAVEATGSSGFSKHNRTKFSGLRKKEKRKEKLTEEFHAWIVRLLCLLEKDQSY